MNGIKDLDAYATQYRDALTAELRAAREENGVTFDQIADYTGLQKKQVHRHLQGERDIPFTRLKAIADAIGCDLGVIMVKVEERLK